MIDAEMNRETQGIQGNHYRDNSRVPLLKDRGRRLVFMDNGHVQPNIAKVRDQGEEKPFYGLVHLYPERAMLYDWVDKEHKRIAQELGKPP